MQTGPTTWGRYVDVVQALPEPAPGSGTAYVSTGHGVARTIVRAGHGRTVPDEEGADEDEARAEVDPTVG
eukprot:910350-Rhodomonas_salina.2